MRVGNDESIFLLIFLHAEHELRICSTVTGYFQMLQFGVEHKRILITQSSLLHVNETIKWKRTRINKSVIR